MMATIRVAETGVPVELFSIVPVKRSHSVCAQGGINAAKNLYHRALLETPSALAPEPTRSWQCRGEKRKAEQSVWWRNET